MSVESKTKGDSTAAVTVPELPTATRFVVALAAVSAASRPPTGAAWSQETAGDGSADVWLDSLLTLLELSRDVLPSNVEPGDVSIAATERERWSEEERSVIARSLVQAALAPKEDKSTKKKDKDQTPQVIYSPIARAAAHRTLELLGLDLALLPRAEADLGASLAEALDAQGAVDEAKNKQKQGWGGTLGRTLGECEGE